MALTRDRTFIWVTWLSRIMAGDKSCLWAAWFRAHHESYEKVPSDFDQARWRLEHTRLLADLATEREQLGEQVRLEGQNRFRYEHPSGLAVAGTPDVVAGDPATVYDCKTGQPRTSDQVQVMLYMYFLPRSRPEYEGKELSGRVVYRTHRVAIPAGSVDEAFGRNVEHWLEILGCDVPARRVPSEMECRFCDITKADCAERIDSELATAGDGTRRVIGPGDRPG